MLLSGRGLVCCCILATSIAGQHAHSQQPRGVNPADIDSRFDIIAKRNELYPEGSAQSLTLKYDYKLNPQWGLNFELPVHSRLSTEAVEKEGNGDFFSRARLIIPNGAWTYGTSVEVVAPTASEDELGSGRYQFNAGGLLVRAFTPRILAAGVIKQSTSFGGDNQRAKISNTELRIVPVVILNDGWAVSGEVRRTWEHRPGLIWHRFEASLSKQLDSHWGISLATSRDSGDRKDDGAASIAMKYFF